MTDPDIDRRTAILKAALACFLDRGYLATTIGDIRAASGATTGSIYHFFEGKGALAAALLEEAVTGWSVAASDALDADTPAEIAIQATVRGLVAWGTDNPALLRFMDETRTVAASDRGFASVRARLETGQVLGEARYKEYVRRGEVEPMPWPVAHSLMLGPAYNYLRLIGTSGRAVRGASDQLAKAAWAAVRRRTP